MKQLKTAYPSLVVMAASPVYWPDGDVRSKAFAALEEALRAAWHAAGVAVQFLRVDSPESLAAARERVGTCRGAIGLLPLSGATQPWLLGLARAPLPVAVLHAYLMPEIPAGLRGELLHRNAHPGAVDSFACLQLAGRQPHWIADVPAFTAVAAAAQAVQRLRSARILKVGETEPWVVNSERSPAAFRDRLGTEVIPVERGELYEIVAAVSDADASACAEDWTRRALMLEGLEQQDVVEACRVVVGMQRLLEMHEADGLSMACFAMIGDINTTSCLALSALNDSAASIGACEGDLDAAVTQFLLKALGADFTWIGNPIIHAGNSLDLVHCTAPLCACGTRAPFKLLRHHESGKGVAPEVQLPAGEAVTLARIGGGLGSIAIHGGSSARVSRLRACHTQLRVHVASSQAVIDSLLGTHFVLSYGDWTRQLRLAAGMLGLQALGQVQGSALRVSVADLPDDEDASPSTCRCNGHAMGT